MNQYTEKFKALGDETRLRMVHLFLKANSELCVCELTDSLEIPQYNVSRHLKILKNAGLIQERKEGRWVYFSLLSGGNGFNEAMFNAVNQIPESLLSKDLAELEKRFSIRTNGKCLIGIQKKHLISSRSGKEMTKGVRR